jgi:2-polyprenyl-3-methyl-5-hydroxy-6-metoxy-1,4-benzoquinol methylase
MSIYDVNFARYGTHKLIAEELEKNLLILDVGCNKGYLKSLTDNSNTFYGLDSNEGDLEIAHQNGYVFIEKINLNEYGKLKLKKTFDVIIFADILEHVLHRNEILEFFIENHLKKNGRIIVSLPNVAHITIRLKLLFGDFTYTEAGILDKTHLHLFTLKSARDFIAACGLRIEREKFSSNRFGYILDLFPILGKLLGYNIILVCRR